MQGYLLDTNHISAYFDKNVEFIRTLESKPPDQLYWISAISLGEIEASYATTSRDGVVSLSFRQWLRETFLIGTSGISFVFPIDEKLRYAYAEVLSSILQKYPMSNRRKRTEHHLVSLGVDINDVWIFATAHEHNLKLLSTDRMKIIREAMQDKTNVDVECWVK